MAEIKSMKEVIELAKENAEMKRALGDIFLFIIEGKKGKNHISIKSENKLAEQILEELSELFEYEV